MTPAGQQIDRPRPAETVDADVDGICEVLGDERSLGLIRTLERSDDAMTAGELAEESDIPESTVYRKMDAICETPIVRGAVALIEDGPQATRYDVVVDTVTLSFTDDGIAADVAASATDDDA